MALLGMAAVKVTDWPAATGLMEAVMAGGSVADSNARYSNGSSVNRRSVRRLRLGGPARRRLSRRPKNLSRSPRFFSRMTRTPFAQDRGDRSNEHKRVGRILSSGKTKKLQASGSDS